MTATLLIALAAASGGACLSVLLMGRIASGARADDLELEAAAQAVHQVRPSNWDDADDPQARDAWLSLQVALEKRGLITPANDDINWEP